MTAACGRSLGLEPLVEVLAGELIAAEEAPGPHQVGAGALEGRLLAPQGRDAGPEQRDRVVDILDRPLELPAQAPGLGRLPRTCARAVFSSASAATRAAFLMSTWTWYGSLSSWTSRSPFFTRSLSSTATSLTCPATGGPHRSRGR